MLHDDDFNDYSTAVGADRSFAYPFYIKVKLPKKLLSLNRGFNRTILLLKNHSEFHFTFSKNVSLVLNCLYNILFNKEFQFHL